MAVETQDVVALLKADHKKVETMLSSLDAIDDSTLVEYLCHLREELVRHEVAEEMVVYPVFRRNVPDGDAIVDACIAEQAQAEELLARLDKHENDKAALRTGLLQLKKSVLAHAEHEEREVFPPLEAHTKRTDLQELGQRYRKALASAPTHPHPHAPDTPPGNMVLGPLAAVVDRVRDAVSRSA